MPYPPLEQIKENIKFARKQAGLTQEEMSKVLNITQPAYSYYETGDKPLPLRKIKEIAEILSIPINRLLGDIADDITKEDTLSCINNKLDHISNTLDKILIILEKSNNQ